MGIAALLRQALVDAQDYEMKKEKEAEEGEIFERDLGMELLVRLLNRRFLCGPMLTGPMTCIQQFGSPGNSICVW